MCFLLNEGLILNLKGCYATTVSCAGQRSIREGAAAWWFFVLFHPMLPKFKRHQSSVPHRRRLLPQDGSCCLYSRIKANQQIERTQKSEILIDVWLATPSCTHRVLILNPRGPSQPAQAPRAASLRQTLQPLAALSQRESPRVEVSGQHCFWTPAGFINRSRYIMIYQDKVTQGFVRCSMYK